jgi:RNA methyltransferase, TrmH family
MISIESKDNSKIKYLRKLNQKKYRDEYSEFLVENWTTIKDAYQNDFKPKQVFIASEFLEKHELKIRKMSVEETYLINEEINKSFSALKNPSGICAVYDKLNKEINFKNPIIYLNAINDPGNLGTILRSALAFNLKNIVCDEKCADLYNSKIVNAAKDSIFKLNIKIDKNLDFLKEIKGKIKIFATRLEDSNSLDILKKESFFCLVLGSESHGVDQKIQDLSNDFIRINMGNEIESLNVAGAAAIIFNYIYNK